MSTTPATLRMVGVSGAEARRLSEGAASGRLVLVPRKLSTVGPARHVGECGRVVVRTPVRAAAVPTTYRVDEVHPRRVTGFGLAHGTAG